MTAYTDLVCACCGRPTLSARAAAEPCSICGWEDGGDGDEAGVVRAGSNSSLSLTEARRNFDRYGASDPSFDGPDALFALARRVAGDLVRDGRPDAASRLDLANSTGYTTASEWLGELGLAIRDIRKDASLPRDLDRALERIMLAVRSAWPKL
jgi:hypothetical protein